MYRRNLAFTALAALAIGAAGITAAPAGAQEARLGAAELEALLTGNTAEGVWDGTPYKSYFAPNGVTVYDPANGEALMGKWRINPNTGDYESFWDAIGWTAYAVMRTEQGYAWGRDGKTYPFTITEGRALSE
ncbi:hypothetical protein [Roseovarius aquimarinus]|uniref:YHS domain protein n=1 Tax=Roseovarius aquimarinus TaxID=1229156 RepID=A0ABW7I9G2_9RHOB